MSESERKKKMISLRLSDAEYAVLKAQFRTHGARNVSDLARLAIQHIMNDPAPRDSVGLKLALLEDRVHSLEIEIAVLLERERALS